jgi:hypothetical protein
MGNANSNLKTHSSVLVPFCVLKESVSLENSCCARGKEDQTCVKETIEVQRRKSACAGVSCGVSPARSAPYTSRLDIEGSISRASLSDDEPEIFLGIPDCKNSDPEPLINWTIEEQQVLIDSLNKHPQARENESYRRRLIDRVRRELPNKSLGEIRECCAYLLELRLAGVRYSRFELFKPVSPRNVRKEVLFQT